MVYLLMIGAVEFLVGLVLVLAPEPFRGLCSRCDRVFLDIDKKLEPYRAWVGIAEVALSAWLLYVAIRFPAFGVVLHPFSLIFLFFGILYIFLPRWMTKISSVAHKKVMDVDEFVMGARRISGFIFILASFYIFYLATRMVP